MNVIVERIAKDFMHPHDVWMVTLAQDCEFLFLSSQLFLVVITDDFHCKLHPTILCFLSGQTFCIKALCFVYFIADVDRCMSAFAQFFAHDVLGTKRVCNCLFELGMDFVTSFSDKVHS